jgi:hypothetical protein
MTGNASQEGTSAVTDALGIKVRVAATRAGVSTRKGWDFVADGTWDSYVVDGCRLVLAESVDRFVAERVREEQEARLRGERIRTGRGRRTLPRPEVA